MFGNMLRVFNPLSPSDAYMPQWTGSALVQVMACHLFGAKPLPELMLTHCQLDPQEQISVKFESKYEHSIEENAIEHVVCKMSAILSVPQGVKVISLQSITMATASGWWVL